MSEELPEWSNGGRCDECGAWCIDGCLRCGAPQCCPQCCKIAELDSATAELRRERDELKEANTILQSQVDNSDANFEQLRMIHRSNEKKLQDELSDLRRQLADARKDSERLEKLEAVSMKGITDLIYVRASAGTLREAIDKLV